MKDLLLKILSVIVSSGLGKMVSAVGAASLKIISSPKFVPLAVTVLLGWRMFDACFESRRPVAILLCAAAATFLVIGGIHLIRSDVSDDKAPPTAGSPAT
jgi:hypothetical protein